MWNKSYADELNNKRNISLQCGGLQGIEKQHQRGKLTARERIYVLLDKGSFCEIGQLRKSSEYADEAFGDGVVTGFGTIDGRTVYVSSQDFTYHGGSLGKVHSEKICRIMDMAIENRCPFISINDSGGARIEEGVVSLNGFGGIFRRNVKASGIIPQIAVILGPCAGGACYSPAICDFVFMTREKSQMFITGPDVVKTVLGEETTVEELGGADVHVNVSGVAHFIYDSDAECLDGVRTLLSYLPCSCMKKPLSKTGISIDNTSQIENIVPDKAKKAYDVKAVISTFVDNESFFEVSEAFAKNIVTGFARIDGNVVGIVANQPMMMAGVLDSDSSDKAARFVRFCDCFNIPLLALVDVPGYLPGIKQEHGGIIRHGAKLLYAFSEASVPKITLIMRKAFGGAFIAMNSKSIGADLVYAWPIAQIAVMGAEGAVNIIKRKEILSSDNPQSTREKLVDEYEKEYLNPYIAADNGYIDEVILPEETKRKIVSAFESLCERDQDRINRKHGNIPL